MQPISQVVVIGGGPAGREAARHAARLGADVALIARAADRISRLDHTAVRFLAEEAIRAAEAWGPEGPAPGAQYASALRETLASAISIAAWNLQNQIAELKAIGIRVIEGNGCISAPDTACIIRPDGSTDYINCCAIILATGREAFFGAESPCILTPNTMPSLQGIPESLIALGSSESTLQLAQLFASYGVSVTVIGTDRPALHFLDGDLRRLLVDRALDNDVRILTEVTAVAGTADGRADILLSDGSHIDADMALPCGGGAYRTEGLGLEGPGVLTGPSGEILVDEQMRTNIPGIFAAGSVTGCDGLNVAIRQACVAAENALGAETAIRYNLIPAAIWFDPPIGAVGLSEMGAMDAGMPIVSAAVYLAPEPGPERCAKLISHESSGRMLGLQAVGNGAIEAAHLGALAVHAGITMTEVADISPVEGSMAECVQAVALRGRQPAPEVVSPVVVGPDI